MIEKSVSRIFKKIKIWGKGVVIFPVLLLLISCSKKEEITYRVVGKNGKAIYLDKKTPIANRQYTNTSKNASFTGNDVNGSTATNQSANSVENDNFRDLPIASSSAYSLESVIDRSYGYGDISTNAARHIDEVKQRRSIDNFDNLPQSLFIVDREKLTKSMENGSTGVAKKNLGKQSSSNKLIQVNSDDGKNYNKRTATGGGNKNTSRNGDYFQITPDMHIPKALAPESMKGGKMFFVQLGFFVNHNRAVKLRDKFRDLERIRIIETKNNSGDVMYKVVVGAYKTRSDAEIVTNLVKGRRHEDVYIFQQ